MSNKDNKDKELRQLLKQEGHDDELAALLKNEAYDAEPNVWFTHRVLSKLPAKKNNSALHAAWFFYAAAVVVCLAFWVWMLWFNDTSVITVRDILYFVIASVVTLVLTMSPIVTLMRNE